MTHHLRGVQVLQRKWPCFREKFLKSRVVGVTGVPAPIRPAAPCVMFVAAKYAVAGFLRPEVPRFCEKCTPTCPDI